MSGHIALIGLSGSGKSSVGRLLADALRRPLYDTDALLAERAGRPVPELLREDEARFRALEEAMLAEVLERPCGVVTTGGGAILSARSRERLKDGNLVIWLRAPASTLAERLEGGEERPLLAGDVLSRLKALERQRRDLYQECASAVVDTDGRSVMDVSGEILGLHAARLAGSGDLAEVSVAVPAQTAGYPVVCGHGALKGLPEYLGHLDMRGRLVLCSDSNVMPLRGERLTEALRGAGFRVERWTMPAGETHKTLATVADAYGTFAALRLERADVVLALGGGVVGDTAGFAAATFMRGLRLVQVPTTVVAQVDSAIGGKVGVDLPEGKNLVGAFHQPALVVADTALLQTLPEREWVAGLAEVIKHGLIRDRALLDRLASRPAELLAREPLAVAEIVARAVLVKVAVVAEDPLEKGLRRILNYGHTFGHAIERVAGYGVVLHGEAVAWGMAAAARMGAALGLCDQAFVAWQDDLLRAYGLLRPLPALDAAALLSATRLDKKSAGGRVSWILPVRGAEVRITADVPEEIAAEAARWLAGASAT